MTPEAKARVNIDALLQQAGWHVCNNMADADIHAAQGVAINRVNSMTHLGKCVFVPKALVGAVFESNMMRVRLKSGVLSRYVEHYLASKIGKKRLTDNAKWAVNQASINQKDVQATQIFVPDPATQAQIVAEVDRRLSIIRDVEAEVDANANANLKRAQALRQATLRKVFSPSYE